MGRKSGLGLEGTAGRVALEVDGNEGPRPGSRVTPVVFHHLPRRVRWSLPERRRSRRCRDPEEGEGTTEGRSDGSRPTWVSGTGREEAGNLTWRPGVVGGGRLGGRVHLGRWGPVVTPTPVTRKTLF